MIFRSNEFEQNVVDVIKKIFNVKYEYDNNNTPFILNQRVLSVNGTALFHDANSLYKTPNNNYRTTELVLYSKEHNVHIRIDAKQQKTNSNIISHTVYSELRNVNLLREDKLFLILGGAYLLPYNLYNLAAEIKFLKHEDRVWWGSIKDFENELIRLSA